MSKYTLSDIKQALYRCPNRDCDRCSLRDEMSEEEGCKLFFIVSEFIDAMQERYQNTIDRLIRQNESLYSESDMVDIDESRIIDRTMKCVCREISEKLTLRAIHNGNIWHGTPAATVDDIEDVIKEVIRHE